MTAQAWPQAKHQETSVNYKALLAFACFISSHVNADEAGDWVTKASPSIVRIALDGVAEIESSVIDELAEAAVIGELL